MEFSERDDHIDDDGEIIFRNTIEQSIDDPKNVTYRIVVEGKRVGGVVLKIDPDTHHNHLEWFFVSPDEPSKGIGTGAWQARRWRHSVPKRWCGRPARPILRSETFTFT